MRRAKLFGFVIIVILLSSCYYDNEEYLYPNTNTNCDSISVSYTQDIAPIMAASCNTCHSAQFPQGNVTTDNYNDLLNHANNGSLLGSVKHLAPYSPMPKGANKLNDCDIAKIENWIKEGSKNN